VKLTVLGGSAAGGNTGIGCSGYLIQHEDTSVVFDLGPGTLLELRKHVDYRSLTAVVISHYHLDHMLDLGALRFLLGYNPVRADRKIPLWIPPGSRERFALWAGVFANVDESEFLEQTFIVDEYDPEVALQVGGLSIRFAPTVHWVPCWAMRIAGGTARDIGYTADTGHEADLKDFFSGVELVVSEATDYAAPTDSTFRGHLSATEAGTLAREAGASTLMITHMWEENDIDRSARYASEAFGKPVLVARPGLTVTV
jgi:ribonuclease BN (tRNA processing enzyme)